MLLPCRMSGRNGQSEEMYAGKTNVFRENPAYGRTLNFSTCVNSGTMIENGEVRQILRFKLMNKFWPDI